MNVDIYLEDEEATTMWEVLDESGLDSSGHDKGTGLWIQGSLPAILEVINTLGERNRDIVRDIACRAEMIAGDVAGLVKILFRDVYLTEPGDVL